VTEHAKVCPACAATALPDAKWCPQCRAPLP
jgi:predicted amidophosphoribosyltransferase